MLNILSLKDVVFDREYEIMKYNKSLTRLKKGKNYSELFYMFLSLINDVNFPFPDIVTFNIVIDTFGELSMKCHMDYWFVYLIEYGIRPNVRTFGSLFHWCSKNNYTFLKIR